MSVSLKTHQPGIAILQVERPEVRNALDWAAMRAFGEGVEQAHAMPELRALVLSGSARAFIAGGDLKELANYPTRADGAKLSAGMSAALARLEALPCPTIAAMNGPARGGGAEISLACDLRVMAADADLGFVHISLGLTPGWGAGQRLLRLAGYSRALEWLATGRVLSAEEALDRLQQDSGKHFDPDCVQAMTKAYLKGRIRTQAELERLQKRDTAPLRKPNSYS